LRNRLIILAVASITPILTACTHTHTHTLAITPTTPDPPPTTTTPTTNHNPLQPQPDYKQALATLTYTTTYNHSTTTTMTYTTTIVTPNITKIMDCIRHAESGNYTESSHPTSGSGAYQYVPQTWQTWSARAGHPGYNYAYQAPPAIQDTVVNYTLTHGGANNWSNRYGRDGCTSTLPGGG
jgi:hypothetical protein